jgi:hypothetical protein
MERSDMIKKRWVSGSLLVLCTAGCFHQVVNTGRTPGTTVVDKPWVSTWLWGLVAAQPVDVRQQCPSGVAVITTEQSFVNGLVGAITLGIYTPQHVTVTCASGGTASLPRGAKEFQIPTNASAEQRTAITNQAVENAIETGSPSVLRY